MADAAIALEQQHRSNEQYLHARIKKLENDKAQLEQGNQYLRSKVTTLKSLAENQAKQIQQLKDNN